jgi:hypothetical protein
MHKIQNTENKLQTKKSSNNILRVDQKKWPGFKTEKQKKKWNDIKKKNVIWMHASFYTTNPAFSSFAKKGGGHVPLAIVSYVSDKKR